MRTLWLVAILACVAPIAGTTIAVAAPVPAASPTPTAASCPNVLLIESTNGKYYIAVFQAHAPTKAAIDLTLYAKSAVYTMSLPEVDVTKPLPSQIATFRSPPAVIRNPGADELLGAAVTPHSGTSSTCPGENIIVPSVASLTDPDRHIDAQADALEADLATEATAITDITTPAPATGISAPACDLPFADASVDQLVKPVLTQDERKDPGLLPADVRVQLDATGAVLSAAVESSSGNASVDAAVIDAASRTTYHPARFACQAESSSHVIHVDFSR